MSNVTSPQQKITLICMNISFQSYFIIKSILLPIFFSGMFLAINDIFCYEIMAALNIFRWVG